ncbi:tow domain-containing protein [Streptomyces laurentii]|uniref:Tow domain-containing protein n=1 Tax=Streptomyces laurentii TaxID=39478 RepID=A0A160NWQ7_STRLU|nr:tow domain-containing protein [Streptomyces laurentii]
MAAEPHRALALASVRGEGARTLDGWPADRPATGRSGAGADVRTGRPAAVLGRARPEAGRGPEEGRERSFRATTDRVTHGGAERSVKAVPVGHPQGVRAPAGSSAIVRAGPEGAEASGKFSPGRARAKGGYGGGDVKRGQIVRSTPVRWAKTTMLEA